MHFIYVFFIDNVLISLKDSVFSCMNSNTLHTLLNIAIIMTQDTP